VLVRPRLRAYISRVSLGVSLVLYELRFYGWHKQTQRQKLRALLGTARSKEEMLADGEGLSVRLLRSGAISWIFAYRLGGRGSKLERLTLGSYPDMSLKMAREARGVPIVVG
jgi:hypothetical protein